MQLYKRYRDRLQNNIKKFELMDYVRYIESTKFMNYVRYTEYVKYIEYENFIDCIKYNIVNMCNS